MDGVLFPRIRMFFQAGSKPRAVSALFVAACLCVSAGARAEVSHDPTPAQIREAAEAFDRGREAYQNQDWVGAAEQFERADAQAPSATAIEYAIRSRARAGQLDRAATLAALGNQRHPGDGNLLKVSPGVLEHAKSKLFELSVECSEPCELAVGGKIVPGAPALSRTLYLTEGKHAIRAGFSESRSDSREVLATSSAQGQLLFTAVPLPSAAPPAVAPPPEPAPLPSAPTRRSERSGWSPAVFWVSAGITGIVGGVTVWSGLDTLSNPGKDRIKSECAAGDASCPVYQQGLSNQRRTNVLIGVTAGAGLFSVLVGTLLTDWSSSSGTREFARDPSTVSKQRATPKRASLAPLLSVGDGAFIGARGRF